MSDRALLLVVKKQFVEISGCRVFSRYVMKAHKRQINWRVQHTIPQNDFLDQSPP